MKKTKENIELKWENKLKEIIKKADYDFNKKCAEAKQKWAEFAERLISKYERKRNAYVNKKKLEYDRKCKNEIRKLEWKEERVYVKNKKKLNKLEFAMDILQENSKLRDTNEEWCGFCISCGQWTDWGHLQGGHRYSRWVKNICLDFRNINAQCKTCNFTTWPRGNPEMKDKTNAKYDLNLDKKYWEWTAEALYNKYVSYFHNVGNTNWDYGQGKISLDKFIEDEMDWNEQLWKWKSFYKPKNKWRDVRESEKK